MNNNSNLSNSGSKGLGFTSALQIAFIVLKLLGKIKWSWLWVLSPIWISLILAIIIIIILFWYFYKRK